MDACRNGWINECKHAWMHGSRNGWMDGWMEKWRNEQDSWKVNISVKEWVK